MSRDEIVKQIHDINDKIIAWRWLSYEQAAELIKKRSALYKKLEELENAEAMVEAPKVDFYSSDGELVGTGVAEKTDHDAVYCVKVGGGAKFTPGPWSALEHCITRYDDDAEIELIAFSECKEPEQKKANAHLIAAAPELYEELESLLDSLAATPELNLSSWGIDTDSAKAALAKARGE